MTLLQHIKNYWYGGGCYRGSLHGILEDGNLEDITLDATIEDFERALVLLKEMRSRTYATRWKAYEAFQRDFAADTQALFEREQKQREKKRP